MFKKLFERIFKNPEKFEVIATVKDQVEWQYKVNGKKHSEDTITWYLELGDRGTRRYFFHSHGTTAAKKEERIYEAPMILWQKTGILPENAEPIEFTAIKNSNKP